jgi:hypothetical protein
MNDLKGDENMNKQFGRMDDWEAYRPHAGRFFHFVVPLAIGFMLGMRKGMMHRGMRPAKRWENGVPPFFSELHRRAHEASDQPKVTEV